MTRKTALKILISVVLIAILVLVYILFFTKNNNDVDSVILPEQPSSNFFPDSESFNPQQNLSDNNDQNQGLNQFNIPNLRQISQNPVAGYVLLSQEAQSTNVLDSNSISENEIVYRYVNRSNGNILETTSKTTETTRLTNNTIPKVYEAVFSENGQNILFRYLEDNSVQTVAGVLTQNISTTTSVVGDEGNFIDLETSFLVENIKNIDVLDNQIFYTLDDFVGLVGYSFNFEDATEQTSVFSSDISQINPKWLDQTKLLFATKPSANSNGFLFEYNLENRNTKKILSGGAGFNFTIKPNSNYIIYSELNGFKINSYSYNLETGDIVSLDLNTIVADKCAWSKVVDTIIYCAEPNFEIGLGYPNLWYQGQVSLNDSLYQIDVESGLKIELDGLNQNFDITNIQLSEDDDFITFINKKDLTLWSLDI